MWFVTVKTMSLSLNNKNEMGEIMKYTVKKIITGFLQENCYIVSNGHNALIIDPGADAQKIIQYIHDEQLVPRAILLTHGHFDHIGAVNALKETFAIPVFMSEKEADWLEDPEKNLSNTFSPHPVYADKAEFNLDVQNCDRCLGDIHFTMIPTPGHSEGSISFLFDDFIIVGDTLFYESIGRSDFPTGDANTLLNTIRQKFMTLPDDIIVYPGHGQATTIGHERQHNPYL